MRRPKPVCTANDNLARIPRSEPFLRRQIPNLTKKIVLMHPPFRRSPKGDKSMPDGTVTIGAVGTQAGEATGGFDRHDDVALT